MNTIPLKPMKPVLNSQDELGAIRELFDVQRFNYVDITAQSDIAQALTRWPLLRELSKDNISDVVLDVALQVES